MLMPSTLKGEQQRKYWDFAAAYELNDLFDNGIEGVKIKIFGTSMDTPGRAELLGACFFCQRHLMRTSQPITH